MSSRVDLPCRRWSRLLAIAVLFSSRGYTQNGFNVLTRNYDNQRTGANTSETILNASNVNASQFGKLFMIPVDDQVYAGVLYVSNLQINGGTHNVLYVETTNNTVYAFDAETLGPPLWARNFNGIGRPLTNADVGQACSPYTDYRGNIGIVGTPVIDNSSGTMYFLTRTMENGGVVQRLRAINILNGNDQANSPQVIQGSVPGTGDGGTSSVFNATTENQRTALALSQGVVYIAWASYCDTNPYHGWVLAYNENSLAQVGAFNDTPNGSQAGIWMSGAGPVFDANGNVYYSTGNGTFDGSTEFGESLVKLTPGSLTEIDFFAPSDYGTLNLNDLDFGSAGPTMLPGTTLLVTGGKEGKIYLLNTGNLKHEASGDVQIPQFFQAVDVTVRPSATHHIHNASPVWNSPEGLNLYVWGENDYLHLYRFNTSTQTFLTPPTLTGTILPPVGMPGGMMTLSANGSQSGSGVLWAAVPRNGDANAFTVPGNLYAFNAETAALLWSSTGTGDDSLNFSKGSPPVTANGNVYVGSFSRFVNVYGLKGSSPVSQNLALNQTATGSTPCTAAQGPAQAFNGSFSGGPDDKWCSSVSNPWLMVDLGAQTTVSRFVLEHAGAGGEDFSLNTSAFNIQVSTDGVNFTTVVNVTGNVDSITTHDITPTTARFIKLNVVTPTESGSAVASIYEFQVYSIQSSSLIPPDFMLAATPGTEGIAAGNAVAYMVTGSPVGGFSGTVTLGASGLPAGATASFSPATISASGSSNVTITTTSATPAGTYTFTISGTSGILQRATTAVLIVSVAGSAGTQVNLGPAYNRTGIVTDGTTFSPSGGLDLAGNAYSANLLGSSVTFQGLSFGLGPVGAPDAVSNATVTLPAGQYSSLAMVGTGVNGNQSSQTFKVTYTDGTSSTFTQSLSDWHTPQSFTGESTALAMAYRDQSNGTKGNGTFDLSGYSFALNSAKTLSSVTLPNNTNVVMLAMTLTGTTGSPDFSFSASPSSQTVTAGSGTSYTASVGALHGFTGTVTLGASGLPTGATASFSPATITTSGTSTASITTTSATAPGTYTVTISGTSGSLLHSAAVTLIVNAAAPDFSFSASPSSQTVTAGSGTSYTASVGALHGFTGTVTLGASGLPTGATASFSPATITTSGSATANITTTSATAPGTYTVTISGTSGSLLHSAAVMLIVNAGGSVGTPVSLSPAYNRTGIVTDGTTFSSGGGLDLGGNAYSANLLGSTLSFQGATLGFGPAGAPDAVSNATVTLPAGQFSTLFMLGTGVNGNQTSQTFKVTYSDGTSSTFTQSLSNWRTGQNYTGESTVLGMAYRDQSNGTKDNRTFNLYGYAFALNSAKTVSSVTLPNNTNVVVLAMTLTGTTGSPDFSFSASPGSQTVTAGSGTSYTASVGALHGFTGTVTLGASGLPTGATASFSPATITTSGSATANITTTSATAPGTYTVTISGTSGSLLHSAAVMLIVNAGGSVGTPVSLSPAYNRTGIVTDGTTFSSGGGLDLGGNAYSANLLGSTLSFQGATLGFGPAGAPDAVSNATVTLPAGQFSTLFMLGTGVNGNQTSQTFKVTYTDGTSSTFTQSLSDWFSPQNYTGESTVLGMAYRDQSNGTKDNRTFNLYGYAFGLNSAKTVSSITLPNNNSVVVLAMTLMH